jgi:UDP-3-O-[3-hydroxymyristoyl] glucosamine N-acyltransferase
MNMTLQEVAALVQGEIAGDPAVSITGVAGVSDVQEGEITFLQTPKQVQAVQKSPAAAVLVTAVCPELTIPQVIVANPQWAFARLLHHFYPPPKPSAGISDKAWVAESAVIGTGTMIAPFVFIADGVQIGSRCQIYPGTFIGEHTVIGDDCILYPNVTVREHIKIGNRVIMHPGVVIGADGFGYIYAEGRHQKIPQVGTVLIEDDVEIGANTTIDRATTGQTVVGAGTKIDNLVQIGHNCKIGRQVILVSQVGIAGSSIIGDGVMMGGQAGIADHVTIAPGTMIGAQCGVMPGVVPKGVYMGCPAMPHRDWLRSSALFAQLPELKKRLVELEQLVHQLQHEAENAKEE